jgi:hypothetical protein
MRGKLILAVFAILSIALISNANALDSDQKSVILTVEQGKTVYIYLYMSGGGSADITHSGDINNWVSHPDTVASGEWLEIKVVVPDEAEIKSYKENILADGSVTTKLSVIVTAPYSSKLSSLQNKIDDMIDEQDDLKEYIDGKLDETNAKITNVEVSVADVKDEMTEMKEMQSDVSEVESRFSVDKQLLQQMIEKLEGDKQQLQQENQQLGDLTGMMTVNWGGAGFALGALLVLVVVIIYFKGGPALGSLRKPSFRGKLRRSAESALLQEKEMPKDIEEAEASPSSSRTHERIRSQGEFKYNFRAK